MLGRDPRRRRLARAATIGAAVVVIVSIASTGAALALGKSAATGAVVKARKTSLGTIVVDARGRTLYMFMKDKHNRSTCSGACAANWPPLVTGAKPTAGAGAKASLLGTTRRSDGHLQATYNGHPLYRFLLDGKAGQTNGEGISAFGGRWYAVSPSGTKVMPSASPGGGYGGGGGGYGGGAVGGY
jgi:predicted lipoprotein with Yx(FWY)xxD motif